ncbi:EmrB/QacA subfamily drug resistance transporter [Paenibacillus cellulosilyticus]|uniref:EmrB/QacA subfamily drug resistance transporter n=1 Tax=Paenibacillus cellulosilyticus TaxID=375489 RepID=A0A2V2YNC7_9BACL|nr:DHA2 family efflux MFS transporter permease subunit [Paenibacillus cellulosilyticus]PWV97321.1 EmrB/QacA subfamily drug resistance transporter [Paenibacillus cellulosilyticus]QKS47479.1 DHA2 family efflux MFS transporter permease subunit [Paenibacillus cellulosilyticus]
MRRVPIIPTETPASYPAFWPVLAAIFLGSFAGMYHVVSLNVSLPGFIDIFDTELRIVQWMLTGFTLASGIIVPVSGFAMDRFGCKRLFLLAIGGVTVSSILCALAWNVQTLIAFRIIQGLFCGLIQPVSLALIYRSIKPERQAFALSVWSFSTVLGTTIGPTLSGFLQSVDWHLIFLVTAPVGVVAWAAGYAVLPQDRGNAQAKLDWLGLLLATVGSLLLLLLFGNMSHWGWHSPLTWSLLVAGTACFALFIVQALQSEHPLLQLGLLRNARFALSLTASLIMSFALYSVVYFLPLFLVEMKGLTPFQTGLIFLPAAGCLTAATFASGRWYSRLGPVKLMIAGGSILFITTYYFSGIHAGTSLTAIVVWLAIRNMGTGLAMTPATNASMSSVPQESLGHASAMLNWLRQVFNAMALGICTSLFYSRLAVHQAEQPYKEAYVHSMHDVFLLSSFIVACAIPVSMLLGRRQTAASFRTSKGSESL